jgi:hypothetical protein
MRKYIISGILLLLAHFVSAQTLVIDSLKQQLSVARVDTNKVNLLSRLSHEYAWSYPDTSIQYAQQALSISETIKL